jgi:adenine-specific DNA methylase
MIERWFPCAEVSDASMAGWGSGNSEASLWVWFAKRPTAQAKAAVLTSLLPWPEDERDQQELQKAVREVVSASTPAAVRAATTVSGAFARIRAALDAAYPDGARVLDPFSGRAMIPLEAARLKIPAEGIDYSPFATLGGSLLAEIPFQDWTAEPPLPFDGEVQGRLTDDRLERDVESFLSEVGYRYVASMSEFYPKYQRAFPWGYLWASTLPCEECGKRFPLVGELQLRLPRTATRKRDVDPGQSFEIDVDPSTAEFRAIVHPGKPRGTPTRVFAGKSKYSSEGRVAVCPFCGHVHSKAVHTRLSAEGLRRDALLVAADLAEDGTKVFREPTEQEHAAAASAESALTNERPFGPMSARPDERIPPGNTWTIQSVNYGDTTYGDLIPARQTLGLIYLAKIINDLSEECLKAGMSPAYVRALGGYATAVMMRKIRRSTRGSRLDIGRTGVGDVFANQSAILHSYDWFESGLSEGSGSWSSIAKKTLTALRAVRRRFPACSAVIQRGTATMLPYRDASMTAIVTDPPYDDMIDYSDSSDLFYVWAKRAMFTADFSLSLTMHPDGVQEKDEEITVKRGGKPAGDHRTLEHYETKIRRAYAEMRRVVADNGVITIVFGHGDIDVWYRMLHALDKARLVMTASWPAKTEAGGAGAGTLNIVTTVTMSCRRARADRGQGNLAAVENQIRAEVADRIRLWERSDLARSDMLMASAGPAMEVAGQYDVITDNTGKPVSLMTLLATARKTVQEILLSKIDTLSLELFDERTKFALLWVELFQRDQVAKSELRWASFTAGLSLSELKTLVTQDSKGCRFILSSQVEPAISARTSVIDVTLAVARAWREGGAEDVAGVLVAAEREGDDDQLWGTITYLIERLPEADPDALTWTALIRSRRGIEMVTRSAYDDRISEARAAEARELQNRLF